MLTPYKVMFHLVKEMHNNVLDELLTYINNKMQAVDVFLKITTSVKGL